jgi:hypothetical protein
VLLLKFLKREVQEVNLIIGVQKPNNILSYTPFEIARVASDRINPTKASVVERAAKASGGCPS